MSKPLKNIKILDIGCGGGLLCEPLSKLGAQVLEMLQKKILKLLKFTQKNNLNINYYCTSPENFITKLNDIVLNMEIVTCK